MSNPHPREFSPAPWPPRVGQLVVVYLADVGDENGLNGYCGILREINRETSCRVQLLDSESEWKDFRIDQLISTGKTPEDLLKQYAPSPQSLSAALAQERGFPDFEKFKRRKSTGKKPKKKKELSADQTAFLKKLIVQKLQEAGVGVKETS